LQLLSSKIIYALVAFVALVSGVVYKMGWFSKVPSGETISAAVSAVSAVAKNTPILRAKVPDVFDGEVPPHSEEPLVSETLQKQAAAIVSAQLDASAPVATTPKNETALVESVVPPEAVSSIKLDSSLPNITLNTDTPASDEAEMANISINI
jgi:hypothetical protein